MSKRPPKQTPLAIKRRRERERKARVEAGSRRRRAAIKGLIRSKIKQAKDRGDIVQALFKASNQQATQNLPESLQKTPGSGRLTWVGANLMDDYIDDLSQLIEHPRPGLTVERITIKSPGERHATTYQISGGKLFKKTEWKYERAALRENKGRAKSPVSKKSR